MKKKLLAILFWGIIVLGVTGCKHGELHKYDDFINYVDNLQCKINDNNYSCGLKGKYEVISDKTETITPKDSNHYNRRIEGTKKRVLTFKIKNTNFAFNVVSKYVCTFDVDGSCFGFTYKLVENFHSEAFSYYLDEYNKEVSFDENLQYYSQYYEESVPLRGCFDIKTQDELTYIIDYMNNFLDYVNSLDFRFIDEYEHFYIEFTENKYYDSNDIHQSLLIGFDIDENGKYIYKFKDEYYPYDGKLETYIYNYMNKEGITVR